MGPKKRQATEPAPASDPKKRVTRSSTKTRSSVGPMLSTKAPEIKVKVTKAAQNTSANSTQRSACAQKSNDDFSEEPSVSEKTSTRCEISNTTVISNLVKKPIECHAYQPTNAAEQALNTLIFTHGAGGTLAAPAVVNFCTGFSSLTSAFTFKGSMNLGARVKGFHACIAHLEAKDGASSVGNTLLLGGRSMGARAAVIATNEILEQDNGESEQSSAVRLILVSYPLQGPKDIRDQILISLRASVEVLFIIGDKDAMCPLDLLNETRSKMTAKSKLVIVQGADHGMHTKPAKKEEEVGEETGRVAAAWVVGKLSEDLVYIGGEEE